MSAAQAIAMAAAYGLGIWVFWKQGPLVALTWPVSVALLMVMSQS